MSKSNNEHPNAKANDGLPRTTRAKKKDGKKKAASKLPKLRVVDYGEGLRRLGGSAEREFGAGIVVLLKPEWRDGKPVVLTTAVNLDDGKLLPEMSTELRDTEKYDQYSNCVPIIWWSDHKRALSHWREKHPRRNSKKSAKRAK